MTRCSPRRTLAVLAVAALTTATSIVTFGGSASAGAPKVVRTQVATPPPPGSGVQIEVGIVVPAPEPLGPLSFT